MQIRYQLDVPITAAVVQQIAERRQRSVESIEFHFEGDLVLPTELSVRVSCVSPESPRVTVDDQPVMIDPLDGFADVSLAAGVHRVRWTVRCAAPADSVSLGIVDTESGNRLAIGPPASSDSPETASRPGDLVVSMLRNQ